MVLLLVFMQLTRDLFAIAKFLFEMTCQKNIEKKLIEWSLKLTLRFYVFFKIQKNVTFYVFFALLHTFSRTMIAVFISY